MRNNPNQRYHNFSSTITSTVMSHAQSSHHTQKAILNNSSHSFSGLKVWLSSPALGIFVQSHEIGQILVVCSFSVVNVSKMTAFQRCKGICYPLAREGEHGHFLCEDLIGIGLPAVLGVFLSDFFCGDKIHFSLPLK